MRIWRFGKKMGFFFTKEMKRVSIGEYLGRHPTWVLKGRWHNLKFMFNWSTFCKIKFRRYLKGGLINWNYLKVHDDFTSVRCITIWKSRKDLEFCF